MRLGVGMVVAAGMAASAGSAVAQTYTTTITTAPDLGKVVSAASGDTVFFVDPASGAVTRVNGSGVRLATTTTRAVVSVTCGNQKQCGDTPVNIKIGVVGSPTRRARALSDFAVAMGSAELAAGPSGSSPISFRLKPIAKNATKTFYVGFAYPIAGDNSGLASGAATAGFYVYAARYPTTPGSGDSDTARATVYRPISISNPSGLAFGAVVRPRAGGGTVVINATTGARSVTGGAVVLNFPVPSRAAYSVTGEGGQTFSISMPATVTLTTAGGAVTVALASTATGSKTFGSALGAAGSYGFGVGGVLPVSSATASGAYSGAFTVTVNYN